MSTLIFLHLVYAGGLLTADFIAAIFSSLHPAAEGPHLFLDRVQASLHPAGRFPVGFADHAQALHPGACAGCTPA